MLNIKVGLPYLSTIITLFISFLISSFSDLDKKLQDIPLKTMPHLEIFENSSEFLTRLAKLNATATSIVATNFSYPPGQKREGPSIDYYAELHRHISLRDSKLESFMVISNVTNREKADWIINRVRSFANNGRF